MNKSEAKPMDTGAQSEGSVLRGFLLGLGLFVAQTLLLFMLADDIAGPLGKIFHRGGMSILTISLRLVMFAPPVLQWFYIIPIFLMKKAAGKTDTAHGIVITAALITLLYGGCSLIVAQG